MSFFGGFFRGFLNSLIITALFALIGVSLFIGDFPPSMSQVRQVYSQYKSLLQFKEKLVSQNNNLSTEDLAPAMEKAHSKQLIQLAASRGGPQLNGYQNYEKHLDNLDSDQAAANAASQGANHASGGGQAQQEFYGPGGRSVANVAEVADAPASKVELPKEFRDQIYALRTEVFRLNQRVIELEKQNFERNRAAKK